MSPKFFGTQSAYYRYNRDIIRNTLSDDAVRILLNNPVWESASKMIVNFQSTTWEFNM